MSSKNRNDHNTFGNVYNRMSSTQGSDDAYDKGRYSGAATQDDRYGHPKGRYSGAAPQDDRYGHPKGQYSGAARQDDRYGYPKGRYSGASTQDDRYGYPKGRYSGAATQDDRYGHPKGQYSGAARQDDRFGYHDDTYGNPKGQRRPGYSQNSDTDTQDYRDRYPGKMDNLELKENVLFYQNKMPSRPEGLKIEDIHRKWYGNYGLLEQHHGYIQWLFPIRESGMNCDAQELQMHEIQAIKDDRVAYGRILTSYRMMLDFYGMKLTGSGRIMRSGNWESRSRHLNTSFHNYMRITRILKCLGEFGYEYLKAPFLQFVLDEAKALPNCIDSLKSYWVMTIKDDAERSQLLEQVKQLKIQAYRF